MPRPSSPSGSSKKRSKTSARKRKDPLFVDGARPRPLWIDYKDLDLLSKMCSRHGKITGRRKTGCTAVSQHAVSKAIKRARFMALLPYVGE
ncbi:MAG: 30S ribosomal protein S18 [Pirellulales bacterium]|nr:30S ribosomal protein S18 [Pirellulales bacterium]